MLAESVSGSDERKKACVVASVGFAQCLEIFIAPLVVAYEVEAAFPVDRPVSDVVLEILVGGDARMSPIAVWEWMDFDEPMMKPRARFQRGISAVLRPIARIIEK